MERAYDLIKATQEHLAESDEIAARIEESKILVLLGKVRIDIQGSAENFFSVGRRSRRIDIIRNFKMVRDNFKNSLDDFKNCLDNF